MIHGVLWVVLFGIVSWGTATCGSLWASSIGQATALLPTPGVYALLDDDDGDDDGDDDDGDDDDGDDDDDGEESQGV